jgi:hypothetical protein
LRRFADRVGLGDVLLPGEVRARGRRDRFAKLGVDHVRDRLFELARERRGGRDSARDATLGRARGWIDRADTEAQLFDLNAGRA